MILSTGKLALCRNVLYREYECDATAIENEPTDEMELLATADVTALPHTTHTIITDVDYLLQ